jgi:Domain of unknown function (DUF397)
MSPIDFEIHDLNWRKARRSAGNGACVEVAAANPRVLVRDSKDQDGPILHYQGSAWRDFLSGVKKSQLDPGLR